MSNIGKILEMGKGHSMNDSPLIEVENEDGTKTTIAREYPTISRQETIAEAGQRAADHAALRATDYQRNRMSSYPDTGDGLDAFYHYLTTLAPEAMQALPQPTQDWFNKCATTKAAIPKE